MQYELRTQVVQTLRPTFQHLVDRYGDRPASRYEEGTIDLQSTTNFHYRPLWGPQREIYSPDYSALKLTDPYSFTDPRQFYYAPYVTARADLHEAVGATLTYLQRHGMFQRLPDQWRTLFVQVLLPMRHHEGAAQLVCSNAARFGWGTSITQCAAYAAFDRIGNAQLLSRVGIAFDEGDTGSLAVAKEHWLNGEHLQPLRSLAEHTIVERDWGVALVTLDMLDQLTYHLLYTHLDDVAIGAGAGSYSLVVSHLSGWFADHRRWLDALYRAWVADPEHGADNLATLRREGTAAIAKAETALAALAKRVDLLVDAGSRAALAAAADRTRASLAGLGSTAKEN